jgi:hypothetical protein
MDLLQLGPLAALTAVAGYFLSTWLLKKDTNREERRRAAAELAMVLSNLGLVRIPKFLVDYSVGDYGGMGKGIIELAKVFLSGEAAVLEEFHVVFDRLLEARLQSEAGRAFIAAKLADAAKAVDPSAVTEAPQATVK